ncbi:MAG: IS5 family transposase, partial [Geminicoccaceae bacterium]|nr:IS5 family transposase [Geminicoccaceae bacterium]
MRFDFGQGNLVEAFVRQRKSRNGWLDDIDQLVDWRPLEALFDHVYASREGAASYPVLVYIKLLFIQQWHGLSDERLEAAVDDRLSFRRFCGIPLDRPVPDHSSVWRFRQHLAAKGEDGISVGERLLAAINAQLDARGLILRQGTLIDATIVRAAVKPPKGDAGEVSELDPDAGFTKKNGETFFGYKAHAAVDEGSGIIRQLVTTSAQIHDSQACDALVQGDEAAVYADKAYDDAGRRKRLKDQGIAPRILYKAGRNRPLRPWQKSFNKVMSVIRAPVERTFAAMKGELVPVL